MQGRHVVLEIMDTAGTEQFSKTNPRTQPLSPNTTNPVLQQQ